MNAQKIKKGDIYYLVLHKRDWTYKPAVIVPVKIIRKLGRHSEWVIVEQETGNIKNRITVRIAWLAPYETEKAENLLYNMKQWEERWTANGWRHRLNHKTAKTEVLNKIASLPKPKQREIWKQFKKVYPELLKKDNTIYLSKMKMKIWDELAWAFISSKYPLKKVWENNQ